MKSFKRIEIEWPDYGPCEEPETVSAAELASRIDRTRERMDREGLSHLVVYGDREHFANLMYLVHFDPRFEEALLIIGLDDAPLLLVGNECEGHLTMSPLFNDKCLRHEVYQPLSLLSQPRDGSRLLKDILASEGIGSGARVGCAGWKYFTREEEPAGRHAIEIPSIWSTTCAA